MDRNNTEYKGYILGPAPLSRELIKKNREITKLLSAANERIRTIPNPIIMFNQIVLIESKASSAIENIITTDDDLFKEVINNPPKNNNASKTLRIRTAVKQISKIIDKNKSILSRDINLLGETINGNSAGYRPTIGTKIVNETTKTVVHTPPNTKEEVIDHIQQLLKYINEGGDNDPITDALLIHHAFEWIHPFIDGNGRVGRVLIGAYLKLSKETDFIFLPLSYFINKRRDRYYEALRAMTDKQDYEFYLNTMYDFLIDAAKYTIDFTRKFEMNRVFVKEIIFSEFGKYHDSHIIDSLFYNAYTSPYALAKHMNLNYRTVRRIIDFLISKNIFSSKREGKNIYYINKLILEGMEDNE